MARTGVGAGAAAERPERRAWPRRHRLALGVRLLAVTIPALAAVVVALVLARLLPAPDGAAQVVLWWVVVVLAMLVALAAGERTCRDLLPLAALFDLELLFPASAPDRLAMWRRRGRPADLRMRIARGAPPGGWDPQTQVSVTVLTLLAMLAAFDERTRRHTGRVAVLADLLAGQMRLPDEDRLRLRWAALLHDVASASVAPDVLADPRRPDEEGLAAMRRHPAEGAAMIRPVRGWLGAWADAVAHHHERWDGAGYPARLAGMQISLGGRIVAVADAFEAMTSGRPGATSRGLAAARQELLSCAGSQFDPAVVRAFLDIPRAGLAAALGPAPRWAGLPLMAPALRRAGALGAGAASIGTAGVGAMAALVVSATGMLQPPAPSRPPGVADVPRSPASSVLPGSGGGPGTSPPGTPAGTASASSARPSSGTSSTSASSTTASRSSTSSRSSTATTGSTAPASAPSSPPPALGVSGPSSVTEGSVWSGTATVSSAAGSTWSGTVDYGDGSPVQRLGPGTSFPLSHAYADEPPGGPDTITVTVSSGGAPALTATTIVRVAEFTPQLSMPPATTIATGTTFTGCGSFTDPSADVWHATVDYGDGGGAQPLSLAGHAFTLTHGYTSAGRYTIAVTVTDDDGAAGSGTTTVRAVNGGPRGTGSCPAPAVAAAPAAATPALAGADPAVTVVLALPALLLRTRRRRPAGRAAAEHNGARPSSHRGKCGRDARSGQVLQRRRQRAT